MLLVSLGFAACEAGYGLYIENQTDREFVVVMKLADLGPELYLAEPGAIGRSRGSLGGFYGDILVFDDLCDVVAAYHLPQTTGTFQLVIASADQVVLTPDTSGRNFNTTPTLPGTTHCYAQIPSPSP